MNEANLSKIKNIYNTLAKSISKIYDYMLNVSSFNLDKADVLKSFDDYFEAFAILNLFRNNNLSVDYFKFVKNIVLYHDLFNDYDEHDYNEDFVIPILNICKDQFVKIPVFVKMIGFVDKSMESSISKAESLSKTVHDSFYELSKIIGKESQTDSADNKLLSILENNLKKSFIDNSVKK